MNLLRPTRLSLLERLESGAVLALARAVERPGVPPLTEFGIRYEALVRRLWEGQVSRLWHAYQLPPRQEVTRLREQMSLLRHRIDLLERTNSGSDVDAGNPVTALRLLPEAPLVSWHERGQGQPLLLLNGWTASGLAWPSSWLHRLERRFRIIRIDNRGTGWSRSAPAPFTIADLADDAYRVLRTLRIDKATVLGLSMGGMIAQELALRHPTIVERLVLVASGPPAPQQLSADPAITAHMFRRRKRGQPLPDYLRNMWVVACAPGFRQRQPDLMDELVHQLVERPTPRSGAMAQARAAAAWHGAGRLARITAPTVVMHGAQDALRPVGNGMRLARLIPGAEYVELPDAGHLLPLEAGDALAEALEHPIPR